MSDEKNESWLAFNFTWNRQGALFRPTWASTVQYRHWSRHTEKASFMPRATNETVMLSLCAPRKLLSKYTALMARQYIDTIWCLWINVLCYVIAKRAWKTYTAARVLTWWSKANKATSPRLESTRGSRERRCCSLTGSNASPAAHNNPWRHDSIR